jgi:F420-non-reducing hydrogenase iron-sulfur subunit
MSSKDTKADSQGFHPRVVGFLCNWCSYAGADLAGTSRLDVPAAISPIRVMCSSRVDPLLIMTALLRGADGVLVAGCHPGDCHYDKGNYYARRRFALTEQILRSLGLEPERVRLSWVSASEGPRYAEVVNEFIEEIRQMGPNPMRVNRSL